jgi:hypothetical protein
MIFDPAAAVFRVKLDKQEDEPLSQKHPCPSLVFDAKGEKLGKERKRKERDTLFL